jgi:hypothetical protein
MVSVRVKDTVTVRVTVRVTVGIRFRALRKPSPLVLAKNKELY